MLPLGLDALLGLDASLREALLQVLRAAAQAPGNRSRFLEVGLIDAAGQLVADWQSAFMRLSILRKSAVRSQPGDFLVDARDVVYRGQTSGSEGQPLVYFAGDRWNQQRLRARQRLFEWWNIPDATPILNLASRLGPVRAQDMSLVGPIDVELIRQLREMVQLGPVVLRGYPSRLCEVAAADMQASIAPDAINVVAVIATGECLFEFQRSVLAKVFQAPVINEYGAQESGISGFSCPEAGRLHLDTDRCLYEMINGELVTTDLWNTTMPIVRYAVGDRVECFEDDCPCGRSGLTVKLLGRQTEVVNRYGQPRWAGELDLPTIDGVVGYQLIQSQPMQLQVNCIQSLPIHDREKLQIWIYETLGLGATALIETTVEFPVTIDATQPSLNATQWLQQISGQSWSSWINGPLPQDEAAPIAKLLQQCIAPRLMGAEASLARATQINQLLDTPFESDLPLEAMKIRVMLWVIGQAQLIDPILYQRLLDRLQQCFKQYTAEELTNFSAIGLDLFAPLLSADSDWVATIWPQLIATIEHHWPAGVKADAFTLYHYLDRLHQVKPRREKTHWRPIAAVLVGDLLRLGGGLDLATVGLWLEMCHDRPGLFTLATALGEAQQVWLAFRRSLLGSQQSPAMQQLEQLFKLAQTPQAMAHCYLEKGYGVLVFGENLELTEWQPILQQYLGLLVPSSSRMVNPLPWMPILRAVAPEFIAVNQPQFAYACLVAAAPPNHGQGNLDRQTQQVNQKQSLMRSEES